jgi:hypothetical protein
MPHILLSHEKRDGEPLLVFIDVVIDTNVTNQVTQLEAGLIFVREEVKAGLYKMFDPESDLRLEIQLPTDAVGLKANGYCANIEVIARALTLEEYHDDKKQETQDRDPSKPPTV